MGPRLFRILVRLMPADFREEYGEEMCQVAEEQWRAESGETGPVRSALFWARQSIALATASARLRRRTHGKTGRMTMDGFLQDVRMAARGLIRRPGFTAVTVLTLGLGIGATTAIFSAVRTVLLRPLPYAEADRVAVLFQNDYRTGERGGGVSAANIRDFRDAATLFEEVAIAEPWSLDLQLEGRTESLRAWTVSRGFFQAMGAEPILGRTLVDADYDEGGSSIVVIGHRSWTSRFAADPGIVGQPMTLDGQAMTVVGVMPAEFRFPDAAEAWTPRLVRPRDEPSRAADFMTGVARLADGVSLAQGQAEADRLAATLREAHPAVAANLGMELVSLRDHLFGDVRTPLVVIMAAVAFVLLIACANVAGLMLARGAQRERDYALRGALGASTGRLVSHVSAESVLLALAGCVLGVMLTYGGIFAIQALGPDHLPRIDELSVDGTVLGFAAVTAALSAILSGFAPSLRLSRPDLRGALGDGSRGSTGGLAQAKARSRLVVTQVAAAVVLLFGAGLLIRSFEVLLDQELGFDPTNRIAVQIFAYDYASPAETQSFVDEVVVDMEALPGVTGVAITTDLPGATDGAISKIDAALPFTIEGRPVPPIGQEPTAFVMQVSSGYFDVMGIDIAEGRDFRISDNPDGTPVMVINEAFARRHFADRNPIGEEVVLQTRTAPVTWQIVGVVGDIRPLGHASEPRPEIYLPLSQAGSGSLTFVVRSTTDAAALTLPVREAIWTVNAGQSVWGSAPLEELVSEWLKERRFTLFLLTAFSVIALLLSAIGLYGLVSFSVERRMGELGIRRALGGGSGALIRMVLGEGARLTATGLAIGLGAAWFLSRFMQGMLFQVEPADPTTFVVLGVVVMTIATAATVFPAIRAMRVDPAEALRSE